MLEVGILNNSIIYNNYYFATFNGMYQVGVLCQMVNETHKIFLGQKYLFFSLLLENDTFFFVVNLYTVIIG